MPAGWSSQSIKSGRQGIWPIRRRVLSISVKSASDFVSGNRARVTVTRKYCQNQNLFGYRISAGFSQIKLIDLIKVGKVTFTEISDDAVNAKQGQDNY